MSGYAKRCIRLAIYVLVMVVAKAVMQLSTVETALFFIMMVLSSMYLRGDDE